MKQTLPLLLISALWACKPAPPQNAVSESPVPPYRVIFDTDANNELDDQHALAYLLLNGDSFAVEGVTVNATFNGGEIQGHYDEADRIIRLCGAEGKVPLLKGANAGFAAIRDSVKNASFDGAEAVRFILEQANKPGKPLTLIAVGKLTNVALAHLLDPSIAQKVRLVWLGSNYPEPGEYNQDNDTVAMNYLLNTGMPFEMVTVRYGQASGSDAVKVTPEEVRAKLPGLGPKAASPVMGRHGVAFDRFGDYSVNLFEHVEFYGNPPGRAMFDMVAVAVIKNPAWGQKKTIPAPILINNQWIERPANPRTMEVWENFNRDAITSDFDQTLKAPVLALPSK